MSQITYQVVKPFFGSLSVARLSLLLGIYRKVILAIKIAGSSLILLVVVQLAYPSNYARPLMHAGNLNLGLQKQKQIQDELASENNRKVTVKAGSRTYQLSRKELGQTINTTAAAKQVTNYGWRDRVKPFSLFKKRLDVAVATTTDHSKLKAFSQKLAKQNDIAPIDASAIRLKDGGYKLVPASNGSSYYNGKVLFQLKSMSMIGQGSINIDAEAKEPAITSEKMQAVVNLVNQRAKSSITISLGGKSYTLPGDTVRTWANIQPDPTTGNITVSYDRAGLKDWLSRAMPQVLKPAQNSVVNIVDGDVAGRSAAVEGEGLDTDKTADSILAGLSVTDITKTKTPTNLTATTKVLTPGETVKRNYTSTSKGLQALVNDWKANHPGVTATVSLQEIGGGNRQASLNPDKLMPSASIYKLFTTWYVLHGVEQGSINAAGQVVNGKNVMQCIDAMIVVSDNDCGVTFNGRYGKDVIDNFMSANGLTSSVFNKSPISATSSEVANFLMRLQAGQLLNSSNTNVMLSDMGRQKYRSAIPAGAAGSTVLDKVGFIDNVWNDAAIVHGPKASYVLVVMTQNGGPDVIKDLTQRIQTLIN